MFTARLKKHLKSEQVRTILLACSHHHGYRVTMFVIIVIISVIITAITIVIIFTTIPARSLHDKITLSLHIRLSSYYHMLSSLVGGIPTHLKNMKVNWDDYSQYMEILWNNIWLVVWNIISQHIGNIVPNHQPDIIRNCQFLLKFPAAGRNLHGKFLSQVKSSEL